MQARMVRSLSQQIISAVTVSRPGQTGGGLSRWAMSSSADV